MIPEDSFLRSFDILYHSLITRPYDTLVPYAFKRFSVLRGFRTILPTIRFELTHAALPPSEKPALFTMNILPPMMTVWYHFAEKHLGDRVDIVIFDSSGTLKPDDFPKARVQKYLNRYAATKSEKFLRHIAKNRSVGWLCDDDMFFLSEKAVDIVEKELSVPGTASVSFRPRTWWEFEIEGKRYQPSSSYCIALNREIFVQKERLTLGPQNGNNHPSLIGKTPGRYDTFDKANETLLKKGYRCFIVPETEQDKYVTGFSGMSGAVMLLNYFKKPEQTIEYFLSAPKERWKGTILYNILAGMLSICTIQELYEKLKEERYPLPALPARGELERLREDHKKFMREDHDFEWIEKTSRRLRDAL